MIKLSIIVTVFVAFSLFPQAKVFAQDSEKPVDLNDPNSAHESGIWLYEEKDGKFYMQKIEPSIFGQTKTGVPIFAIYGQTSKARSVMNPAHSDLRLTASQPIFYFYFEKAQSDLNDSSIAVRSPENFVLLKMEVREDHNERRVIIGKVGLSSTAGYDGTQIHQVEYQKISPQIFKVTPKESLPNGEYCFLYSGASTVVGYGFTAGGPSKGFCFGIQGPVPAKTTKK